MALIAYLELRSRPRSLPLASSIDGPEPAHATGVVFFLHGRGGSLGQAWGDTAEDQAESRARVRSLLRAMIGEHGPPPERVVIAGFSQGAHGRSDPTCPVNESRSLATVLEQANVPVRYIEFDGAHVIPPEAIDALVALATPR
ncbi:hypothetical protein BH09MYX1_BH09MYX1_26260 [soil metagenome]